MIDWTSSALRDRISVSQIALQYLCIKYILLNCTAVFMLLIYMCNDNCVADNLFSIILMIHMRNLQTFKKLYKTLVKEYFM